MKDYSSQLDIERARAILNEIGGGVFGEPDIAEDAGYEFLPFWRRNEEKAEFAAWQTFLALLKGAGKLEEAFIHAWPTRGVLHYAMRFGLSEMDADDINAETMIGAWRSFEKFLPTKGSWNGWLIAIAYRRVASFLRKQYSDPVTIPLSGADHLLVPPPEIEIKPGYSIPIICSRWLMSGDYKRAQFARLLLDSYNGRQWVAPTSDMAASIVGVSRSTLWYWFKDFTREVIDYESKS